MNGWVYEVGNFEHFLEYEQWLNQYGAQGYRLLDVHSMGGAILATMGKETAFFHTAQTSRVGVPDATSISHHSDSGFSETITPPPEVIPVRETSPRYSPPRSEPGRYK